MSRYRHASPQPARGRAAHGTAPISARDAVIDCHDGTCEEGRLPDRRGTAGTGGGGVDGGHLVGRFVVLLALLGGAFALIWFNRSASSSRPPSLRRVIWRLPQAPVMIGCSGPLSGRGVRVPIVQRPRTPAFHAGNAGSNPAGDASLRSPASVSELRLGKPASSPRCQTKAAPPKRDISHRAKAGSHSRLPSSAGPTNRPAPVVKSVPEAA